MTPSAAAWSTLLAGSARDLRSLHVRLAPLGPHPKPRPAVYFTTYYQAPDPSVFEPLVGVDPSAQWFFVARPEEMVSVVQALGPPTETPDPFLAASFALRQSRLGDVTVTSTLDRAGASALVEQILGALDDTNGTGRLVLGLLLEVLRS